jgi:hypothetical protein
MAGEPRPAFPATGRHPLAEPDQPGAVSAADRITGVASQTRPEREVEFTFRGPESLRRRLRIAAARSGRSMKELYEAALVEYLTRQGM